MTLDEIKKGEMLILYRIDDETVRQQAIRLGMYEGVKLFCLEKLSGGPIVLQSEYSEMAVGRKLAEKMQVKRLREYDAD